MGLLRFITILDSQIARFKCAEKAGAQFHEELAQVVQQASLHLGLLVALRQVEKIKQLAILENSGRIMGQNSHRRREYFARQGGALGRPALIHPGRLGQPVHRFQPGLRRRPLVPVCPGGL